MENGRIRDIGPSSLVQAPKGAAVVDLAGTFIVPGIINAHGLGCALWHSPNITC